ncbi:lysophospholipid acyltransferase family protein [Polaribacter sp. R77954]|uniref:lysophospholipid acyltransferase family protein n=1 Tax=Polaribacter sp. R77954 TaxID=3093870 RepID=UPI0037C734E5
MQFLIFGIVYPFVWLLSKLPMRILYIVSDILYVFVYYVFKYRKTVVLENLTLVFPEKTLAEKKRISKYFFKHFTDSFIETIKAISISKKEILKRYQYKNPELVKEFLDQGKSIAFVSAHQANWEWFASAPMVLNCRARGAYTSIGNKYFDKIVKDSRERFGFICYESAKTVKAFYEDYKAQKQSIYLLISDQSPQVEHTLYWASFLGIKVPFHVGAESLAKKFDLVVINSSTKKIKRGYYETEFELISENPKDVSNYQITDKYIELTEKLIKQQPEFYLWSHKRFKHRHRLQEWKALKKNKLKKN